MAHVLVIQRNAHLACGVRVEMVNGSDGKVAKAVLTAISNVRRGSGDSREEEATAIQWTLWGRQAEYAAAYLSKGSHVNVVGRMRSDRFERDGQAVHGMAFTADEVDYLDSRAAADARRGPSGPAAQGRAHASNGEAGRAGTAAHEAS